MASPFSGWVLVGGVVIASPALRDALVGGTMPVGTAAVRVVTAMAVVWVGGSLLGGLLRPTAGPARPDPQPPRARPGRAPNPRGARRGLGGPGRGGRAGGAPPAEPATD